MAHAHDASNNSPKKELLHALIGIVLFLVLAGGIVVSAWLRPAGNHEPATVSATEAGKALDELNKTEAAPTDEQKTEAVQAATSETATSDTAASATAEASAAAQVADSNGDAEAPAAGQEAAAQ